jgi:hypothetical protein
MGEMVIRRAGDTAGMARRMRVEVDGVEVARLKPKEQFVLKTATGVHQVRAEMDWTASAVLPVEVTDGVITVEVSMPWSAMFTMIVRPRKALRIRMV